MNGIKKYHVKSHIKSKHWIYFLCNFFLFFKSCTYMERTVEMKCSQKIDYNY